ncbi:MAG TPA: hypothetical protein VFY63_02975 [Pseudorhizobium sp.]|nr:hypothetical protein [Pseudorhizobium sp.]
MKIDSGLSGYPYPTRSYTIERVTEEAAPREAEQPKRSASAITGSSTLLSSSLANALWVLGGTSEEGSATSASPVAATASDLPVDWVEDLYMEFSEGN